MSELVDLTRELVAIPSHEDETAAGDRIERWLRQETDAAVERDKAGNVLARRGADGADGVIGAGSAADLALVGHHDVVPPDESQLDADGEYVIDERDGRLYGRGTADMKGALAAAMLSFRDSDPAADLAFASFVGEEVGGVGARAAVEAGLAPERAVVVEGSTGYSAPGVTDVAVAHRGRREHTLTVHGVAAHASEPAAGENAIYGAADVIRAIEALEPVSATVRGHDLAGSAVVTQCSGGSAANVVPDQCSLTVDERTVPGASRPMDDLTIEDALGDRSADGSFQDRVDREVGRSHPAMICEDEAFLERAIEAAGASQDGDPTAFAKPHATDAGILDDAGTECLVIGPAEPGEAHTAEESVSIEILERCLDIYRALAETPLD
jgi:acetylornithine deacetylase